MSNLEEIRKQNQKTIIMLLLAFIVPVLAAYLVYFNMESASNTNNNGELIVPPRPVEEVSLQTSTGENFDEQKLKGRWHLVYIGKGSCDSICKDRLSTMHQTRMGQGKEMSRVGLLYISTEDVSKNVADDLQQKFSRLTVLTGRKEQTNKILKLFKTDATSNIMEDNFIFMIDPLGNLMMRYKKDVRLIGIIQDLEHLLKVSHIG